MTTAVIGATGRVGSQIVRGLLARGDAVAALVRDPGKARRAFGEPGGLHIRPTRLDDPPDLTEALDGIRTVLIAMGSTGIDGGRMSDPGDVLLGRAELERAFTALGDRLARRGVVADVFVVGGDCYHS